MKYIKAILPFLLFPLSIFSQTTINGSFMHQGINRSYILYVPASYQASQPVPLLLNLHGYTSNAQEQMLYGDFRPIADTANFIIVHPNGSIQPGSSNTQFWNMGLFGISVDDVDFLETLIDTISAHYNINQRRVYSAGMSNGGYMSYYLACESERFAAVGSVTGSMTTTMYSSCNPVRPIPTIEVHGTADPVVPYAGNASSQAIEDVVSFWVAKNNCLPSPIITNVPNTVLADSATADHYLYTGGTDNHTIEFFKVYNGEHTWPGNLPILGVTCRDFSASQEIWRFFSQYENPTASMSEEDNITFNIWPNPTSDWINIRVPKQSITQVRVYDLQGKTLLQEKGNGLNQLYTGQLKSGSYILEVEGAGFITREKLVIK